MRIGSADEFRVRDALIRQWRAIARAVPGRDLETASRVEGWRNLEVVAHLTMQPVLLVRFLATAGSDVPHVDLAQNLSGTRNLAELVDAATHEAARAGKTDFAMEAETAIAALVEADLATTVTTIQGPILLSDYLVTRCVEAVVHGGDLVEPVEPDPEAQQIVADALVTLLQRRAPEQRAPALVAEARAMGPASWIAIATGRVEAPVRFETVVPLMA